MGLATDATKFEPEVTTEDDFDNILEEATASTGEEPEETPEVNTDEAEETATDGPARDAQGRFAKKEPTEGESEQEAPADSETEATTPETPAVEATAEPEPDDPGEDFVFQVSGKGYTLEGAKLFKDGLYVPAEQVENARRAIQEGTYYRANWQNLERQNIDKGYQKALAEAPELKQARAIMQQIEPLLTDPEAAAAFLQDFHTNAPVLRARAEAAVAREQYEALQNERKQQQESGQQEQQEQLREHTLSETMNELWSVPDAKILTKEDRQVIERQVALLRQRNALFVQREDGEYLDVPAIEEIATYVIGLRKEAIASAKKAEEATKFNAANKPKPNGKPASAAVAPRKGGAPKETARQMIDARDTARAFLSGELDEID